MSLIKPASLEEFDAVTGGAYDEHDTDENFGTRQKELMQKIAKLATKRLTERQLSIYTRFYVDGKRAAEIAEEDGIHISAVYRHLKKAEKNIFEFKEIVLIYNGREGLLDRFGQVIKSFTPSMRRVSNDYYINALTVDKIAKKYGTYSGEVRKIITVTKTYLSRAGISSSDVKSIRKMFGSGVRL